MVREAGAVNTFRTNGAGRPRNVVFKPFYTLCDRNYSVYFDLFDQQRWENLHQSYLADLEKKKDLEVRTIDYFQPGEMQPERDHRFKSEKSWIGELKHKKYREADRGGWFSADLKKVTLTFRPREGHRAGPVFGVRMVKK